MRLTILHPMPTADDLSVLLGVPFDNQQTEQAEGHIRAAQWRVYEYTRGAGFSADASQAAPAIVGVIQNLAQRSMQNPTADTYMAAGSLTRRPGVGELLLGEVWTLNNYRVSTY